MAEGNPDLYEENRAILEGLLRAGVPCEAILTSLYANMAPHILNAALEDAIREAAGEYPVERTIVMLGRGKAPRDPRTGRPPRFDPRKPFAPNPTVTGADGKRRTFEDSRKKKRKNNPSSTVDLVRGLKF